MPEDRPQWFDLKHLLPSGCSSILDIGCGRGQTLSLCPDIPLRVGIDNDPQAVSLAMARIPEAHFQVARAEALPFADRTFDVIVSCVSLPYMNIPVALRECARVIRPSGKLFLSIHTWEFTKLLWRNTRPNLAGSAFRAYVTANGLAFHFLGRVFPYPIKPTLMESFQTVTGLERALRRAGFADLSRLARRVPSFTAVRCG